ncbi:hypothetical protein LINPERPRIM_LOCUS17551 [Linum perenne]
MIKRLCVYTCIEMLFQSHFIYMHKRRS